MLMILFGTRIIFLITLFSKYFESEGSFLIFSTIASWLSSVPTSIVPRIFPLIWTGRFMTSLTSALSLKVGQLAFLNSGSNLHLSQISSAMCGAKGLTSKTRVWYSFWQTATCKLFRCWKKCTFCWNWEIAKRKNSRKL